MMVKQHVSGLLVMAGVVFVSACDNSDRVAAPTAAGNISAASHDASTAVITPAPIVSGVPLPNVCLDIKGGAASAPAAGAPIQAWQCHGGANQQLVLQTNGSITGYNGSLCLDVWGAQANDGDQVVAWNCNGGANQKWTYTSAGQLQTAVNGKCLDLWGAKGENGAKIVVWPCHGGYNQRWTVKTVASTGLVGPVTPVLPIAPALPTVTAGTVTTAGSAELPRTFLNTAMPAVTGRTLSVPAGGDLQAALNAAQPGDQVVLAAGATYVGNFTLPAKAGMTSAQWITVRTSGTLPAEGTRVGPSDAAQMPKILTPNSSSALWGLPGSQGWRLTGLEIAPSAQAPFVYALLAFGSSGAEQSATTQVPSRFVLDRSYVHGTPQFNLRRCILLNSAASAVVDSYVADCHSNDSDSQAILGYNGSGPFKIVNNHLEGGHQGIMFGGADPSVPGLVPSDIEIRRNDVVRPLAWKGVWQAKNLLELKAGQRVLVEANVFENNWADAQNGFAFVWWSLNADGTAPWTATQDITFRYNVVRNVAQGFNLNVGNNPAQPLQRVTIVQNVVTGPESNGGRLFQLGGSIAGVTIANNSGLGGSSALYFTAPDQPMPNFVFRDNVTGGQYNFFAGGSMGAAALTRMGIPAVNVTGNVVAVASPGDGWTVPPGNAATSPASAIGFANFAGGDLTLSAASPFLASGSGGARPGADVATVTAGTQGVVR